MLGPLDPSQFPFVNTSRFGVIPKGSSGKWLLIVDMSAPEGASINDGINEVVCSLSYVSVANAVHSITSLGQGALLAKVDVKSNVPIHPEDRWLMGMNWEGALYIDTALPFGLQSAPKIFTALADAAEWQAGVNFILHYLGGSCTWHFRMFLGTQYDAKGFPAVRLPSCSGETGGPDSPLGISGLRA